MLATLCFGRRKTCSRWPLNILKDRNQAVAKNVGAWSRDSFLMSGHGMVLEAALLHALMKTARVRPKECQMSSKAFPLREMMGLPYALVSIWEHARRLFLESAALAVFISA